MPRLELRLLGHQVDRAARLAVAIQRCRRPFEKLNALDIGRIARCVEAAIAGKAVAQQAHACVLMTGKTANREIVPSAAEVVLA